MQLLLPGIWRGTRAGFLTECSFKNWENVHEKIRVAVLSQLNTDSSPVTLLMDDSNADDGLEKNCSLFRKAISPVHFSSIASESDCSLQSIPTHSHYLK